MYLKDKDMHGIGVFEVQMGLLSMVKLGRSIMAGLGQDWFASVRSYRGVDTLRYIYID
jgi:hypothetical protein